MFFVLNLPNKYMPKVNDTSKHQGLRNKLVKLLEDKGITNKKVLDMLNR